LAVGLTEKGACGIDFDVEPRRRRRRNRMIWELPSFVEIEMNAEIGSYQEDYDGHDYDGL
jgi:hypothetical protein